MMERNERLRTLAKELYELNEKEKQAKEQHQNLRDEILRLVEFDYKGKDHLLPVRTFEVPQEFFEATGLSYEEFITTRSPGWVVEHVEKNIERYTITFILKKDPAFINRVIEVDDGIRVSKEISEYSPEIDWETLMLERPDLYEKLAKQVVVIEVNDEALEQLVEESPEELATLQRHMKVKKPTTRLVPRKVKDDG